MRANGAASLRGELGHRAQHYARTNGLPHCLSYGEAPTVCFERYADDSRHGNFLPAAYRAILGNENWRRRLQKVHTQGRTSLPRPERGVWRELDSCASSDALLMNVFCCPRVFKGGGLYSMLNLKPDPARPGPAPEFGFRARVPLANGRFDRTEVDMRLGDLLVEAKLTENDFQQAPKPVLHAYRDFEQVFDCAELPQTPDRYLSYQLLRNVLAAHAGESSFCLLADARRLDLIEDWYTVLKCVLPVDLRLRCRILTWQELAHALPGPLRGFLAEKYGIE